MELVKQNVKAPWTKSKRLRNAGRRPRFTRGFVRAQKKQCCSRQMVPEGSLIVAMDLGKKEHSVWISTTDKRPLDRLQISHSLTGMDSLIAHVRQIQVEHGLTTIVFAMEPTSHFWMVICSYLERHKFMYVLVQPLSVKRERESTYFRTTKSDYRDAELIANLSADRKFTLTRLPHSPLWAKLNAAAVAYVRSAFLAVDEQLRIQSFLERLYPDYTTAFKSVDGATAMACICCIDQVAVHSAPEYLARVRAASDTPVQGPKILRFHQLVADPQRSWGASIYDAALQVSLRHAAERWQQSRKHQHELETILVQLYEQTGYGVYLNTIPHISSTMQAVLLGLLGDPGQYESARSAVKFAGLDVKENTSGDYQGSTPVTHRGRPELRYIAVQIVFALKAHDRVFQRRYQMLTHRRQHPLKHQQALVALACKYLRMVWTMCVHRITYNQEIAQHGTHDHVIIGYRA